MSFSKIPANTSPKRTSHSLALARVRLPQSFDGSVISTTAAR